MAKTGLKKSSKAVFWTARLGALIIIVYAFVALFAPWLAPYKEADIVGPAFSPWGQEFLLGTDNLGRDMVSRLIYGARNTMAIALLTTLVAFAFGGLLGLLAASLKGWVDEVLSRIVDVAMAIPSLIFALLLLTIFGTNMFSLVVVIAFMDSTRIFRLTRALANNVVVMEFVEAAKIRGESFTWLIRREILPNIMPPLIAEFGLRFCFVFLTISALSFLGLGLQPPTADWGSMVRDTSSLISFGDITPLIPAAAIAILTLGVNFVVDGLLHSSSGLKD